MAASLIISTQFKAIDKFTNVVRKMTKSTSSFANKTVGAFRRVDMAANKMAGKVKNAVGGMGLAVGAAGLVMAMGSVITVFADFEQANAGLASVMNTTVEKNILLSNDAKRLGATTAKTATEVVGLQEAYARLGFGQKEIIALTGSTISGSIAMKGELADTAELVGGIVKSFDNLSATSAPKTIDQLTLSTQKTALNFEKLNTAIPIVAGSANAAGVPFTKMVAVLGTLADANIDASTAGTAFRKILGVSAKAGVNYEVMLAKVSKSSNKLKTATEIFGLTAATQAVILADNIAKTNGLDVAMQNASGTADTAANKQLKTLNGRLTLLGSAYEGFIQSMEDGTGSFSQFLSTVVEIASEVLALASGTAKATDKLTDGESVIRGYAETANTMLKVLKFVAISFVAIKVGILAYKAVMFAITAAQVAYNVVGGITIALQRGSAVVTSANTVAYAAYAATMWVVNVAAKALTAAQWLFNAALTANPIGLVIVGIVALGAAIAAIIYYWEDIVKWVNTSDNAFAKFISGSIAGLIAAFEYIKELWSELANSDFIQGAGDLLDSVGGLFGGDETEPLNPDATIEKVRTERSIKTENQKVDININDKTNRAEIAGNTGGNIKMTNTLGI